MYYKYLVFFIIIIIVMIKFTSCKKTLEGPTIMTQNDALKIADKIATEKLAEFNKLKNDKIPGRPFLLEDYSKTIAKHKNEQTVFIVSYQYKKPVAFIGYPQHFSVQIDYNTGETKFLLGR